jgi:hypothetical protein
MGKDGRTIIPWLVQICHRRRVVEEVPQRMLGSLEDEEFRSFRQEFILVLNRTALIFTTGAFQKRYSMVLSYFIERESNALRVCCGPSR